MYPLSSPFDAARVMSRRYRSIFGVLAAGSNELERIKTLGLEVCMQLPRNVNGSKAFCIDWGPGRA
jgi:hypothetical protein